MDINATLMKLQAEVAKGMNENALQKALTTTSNIVNYDLQAPAKNLYPVITPLRNRIPRVPGNGGRATNWKAILGIIGSGVPSMGWIPEGQRSGRQNYSAIDVAASYRTLGEEDNITEEAINAGIGFEDMMARMTMRLLQGTMIKDELGILGGNNSVALGTPGTLVSTAPATAGATLPADTYSCQCVALTLEGWVAAGSLVGGASGATLQQAVTVTGADGKTYVVNGGTSNISAVKTQAITLGQGLGLTVPAIPGALAYAWFLCGVAGAGVTRLEQITTTNSVLITAPLAGTGQTNATITADYSRNANIAFNGLLYSALAGSGAYINTMATGTAGTGTPLTAGTRRNVYEIDQMLKKMWDTNRISPTCILVNSQELQNITSKVMNTNSTPLLLSGQADPYAVVANGVVTGYFNPLQAGGGGLVVPIILHPNVPPGTIVAWAENLPQQFQSNETPNVAEMHVRKEYVQTFWPQVTRTRDVGVYVEETMAVYFPAGMGVITNIANG